MANESAPYRPKEDPLRTECKQRYSSKEEVRRKWLKEYGSIDENGSNLHNRDCMTQLFNLLDYCVENALEGYLRKSEYLGAYPQDVREELWLYHDPAGDREMHFRPPINYNNRVWALNGFRGKGNFLPENVRTDTRLLRNGLTHINDTTLISHVQLSMDELRQHLEDIGTALHMLGMLDSEDIHPDFEKLRIREGSMLLEEQYKVGKLLGEGGMSRVYRGVQQNEYLSREVAIKELIPDTYIKDTIRNECAVLTSLKHAHIPTVYDAFSQNGTYYIVMELIDGENLDDYLKTHNLTDAQRDRIADGLCDILAYIHGDGQDFVYSDLKPSNVMIDKKGDPNLIDFGITRIRGGDKTQRYLTPNWSAPEVFTGRRPDKRSDVYALGKVLGVIYGPEAAAGVRDVISCCTELDPRNRFENVEAVRRALKTVAAKRSRTKAHAQPAAKPAAKSAAPQQPVQRQTPRPVPQPQGVFSSPRPEPKPVPQAQPAVRRVPQPAKKDRDKQESIIIAALIGLVAVLAIVLIILLATGPKNAANTANAAAANPNASLSSLNCDDHTQYSGREILEIQKRDHVLFAPAERN